MYVCAELSEVGGCSLWVEFYGLLPPLSIPDALMISSGAFGIWGICWAVRLLVLSFINR